MYSSSIVCSVKYTGLLNRINGKISCPRILQDSVIDSSVLVSTIGFTYTRAYHCS